MRRMTISSDFGKVVSTDDLAKFSPPLAGSLPEGRSISCRKDSLTSSLSLKPLCRNLFGTCWDLQPRRATPSLAIFTFPSTDLTSYVFVSRSKKEIDERNSLLHPFHKVFQIPFSQKPIRVFSLWKDNRLCRHFLFLRKGEASGGLPARLPGPHRRG